MLKIILAGALALSVMAAGAASAQPYDHRQDHRGHQICSWKHHHRVCRWMH